MYFIFYYGNSFLLAAMVNAGIGPTHVNTFLTTLNIPAPHHKSLTARHKEALKGIAGTASESCAKAVAEEVSMVEDETSNISDNGDVTPHSVPQPISVSYDAGWSKRGTGRSYDSNTGHGSLIGSKSRKCLDFPVRSKVCDTCSYAKRAGCEPKPHICYKNWTGSSKAMEPDMAVEMINNLQSQGHSVGTLIMDNVPLLPKFAKSARIFSS